jgi:hypothetical protein
MSAVPRTRGVRLLSSLAVLLLALAAVAGSDPGAAEPRSARGRITIDVSGAPIAEFRPDATFGAALDGHEKGTLDRIYTPDNIAKMRGAGLRRITYRLRTELGIEAWHWSEQGSWSDAAHQQGYWVSSSDPQQDIQVSHGYRLPRRGNTIDQADDDGYSRLTDGDVASFWKSNPYLDQRYTGDQDDAHPQWVVIDFGKVLEVNAAKILWGQPYARRYEFQYWVSDVSDFQVSEEGAWRSFSDGAVSGGDGTPLLVKLAAASPIATRYVRILLHESSGTAPPGSTDPRDALGFAIAELYIGTIDERGWFEDAISHGPSNYTQTVIYTSSTDPWHRAGDLDPNTEQPGFDRIFGSGLTSNLPVLMPVAMLYDTPENAAAEIRYFKAHGYPVRQIEMGEEPDGQFVSAEHEAALYLEFATAIHQVDPTLALGGPSFQSGIVYSGFDVDPHKSWVTRFVGYLRRHGRLQDYGFLSFEWYPFDDLCGEPATQLMEQPERLARALRHFRDSGIRRSIPRIISEYGYSSYAGRTLVEVPSALLNADIAGQFLTHGGKTAYLFGYEPNRPGTDSLCGGYGQLMLFEGDANLQAHWPMPTYFGAWLMTQVWTEPGNQRHRLYGASSDIRDGSGRQIVTAYAVRRPDRKWAVMLVNKDPDHAYSVRVGFAGRQAMGRPFHGNAEIYQYSSEQYAWQSDGGDGQPSRSDPPRHFAIGGADAFYLPPFSLTVARGMIAAPAPAPVSAARHPAGTKSVNGASRIRHVAGREMGVAADAVSR